MGMDTFVTPPGIWAGQDSANGGGTQSLLHLGRGGGDGQVVSVCVSGVSGPLRWPAALASPGLITL